MSLDGRNVIVTGAGAGIGRAIALAVAGAGGRVTCVGIDEAAAGATTRMIRDHGGTAIAADVGEVALIDAMLRATTETLGPEDVLVNKTGVTVRKPIMDLTELDGDRIHRINARGVFFCLQRAAREMIPRGSGCIVNIASTAGRVYAGTSNAAHAASKGGLIALTRTAAQHLGEYGINVNAVCPGVTRTPLLERSMARRAQIWNVSVEEAERRVVQTIPIRRLNEPGDIAGLTVFLASPAARNVTGQAWNVDDCIITS